MLRRNSKTIAVHFRCCLADAAPGSLALFSTLTEAVPGSGRGRGTPKSAGGPPRDRPNAPGSGGQQRRPPTDGSKPAGRGGGQGPRSNDRNRQYNPSQRGPPRQGGRGGGARPDQTLLNAAAVVKEALETKTLAVRMPVPGQPNKSKQVNVMDIIPPHFFNSSNLPFLKYLVDERDIERFFAGTLRPDEQAIFAQKLQGLLANSDWQQDYAAMEDLKVEVQPESQIEKLFTSPDLDETEVSAENLLDVFKQDVMELFNLTEAQYDKYKQEALEEVGPIPNTKTSTSQESESDLMQVAADAGLTSDKPNYQSFIEKVRVIEANPEWPHERKRVFVRRLAKVFA